MTRKERIAQLLYSWLTTLIDSTITESWEEEYKMSPSFRAYVDAILALSLDVPDNNWIRSNCPYSMSKAAIDGYEEGATNMRDEIIKRNT